MRVRAAVLILSVAVAGCGGGEPAPTPAASRPSPSPRHYTAYDTTKPETACAFANWTLLWSKTEGWVATGWVGNMEPNSAIDVSVVVIAYNGRDEPVARVVLPQPILLKPRQEQFFRASLSLMQGQQVPIRIEPAVFKFSFAPVDGGKP